MHSGRGRGRRATGRPAPQTLITTFANISGFLPSLSFVVLHKLVSVSSAWRRVFRGTSVFFAAVPCLPGSVERTVCIRFLPVPRFVKDSHKGFFGVAFRLP